VTFRKTLPELGRSKPTRTLRALFVSR